MAVSNNVTRLLQNRGVPFVAHELPPDKLGALETADILSIQPELVFKTIVLTRDHSKRHILALLPGTAQVDLKKVARALEEKKVRLPTEREAERLTGLQAGGISPLALLHRPFSVILDTEALNHPHILISGGQRGLNIQIAPSDLIEMTGALCCQISSPVTPDRSD